MAMHDTLSHFNTAFDLAVCGASRVHVDKETSVEFVHGIFFLRKVPIVQL